jgi:hypothetical protein
VATYQTLPPKTLPLFLNWIGMTEESFYEAINQHKSPTIGESVVEHKKDAGVDKVRLEKSPQAGGCNFVLTPSKTTTPEKQSYTIIGRGWVDKK